MTEEPPEDPSGRLRPTGPGALTAWLAVGLVGGWSWHRVLGAVGSPVPVVAWTQGLALVFVAAVLAGVAWLTRRSLRGRAEPVEAHRMVNRLVLARACALVGALLAGGYLGYVVGWVGVFSEIRTERIVRALLAAAGGALMTGAAIALERACRVRSDDEGA